MFTEKIYFPNNNKKNLLIFSNFNKIADGGTYIYECSVFIRTDSFQCEKHNFPIDAGIIEDLPSILENMYNTLSGTVTLRYRYEQEYVAIEAKASGLISINGMFGDFRGNGINFNLINEFDGFENLISGFKKLNEYFH